MYFVRTEQRAYNSVDSPEQFKVIRENWNDHTPVIRAFKWTNPHGWLLINPYDFEFTHLDEKEK